jgi:hypothetical protein
MWHIFADMHTLNIDIPITFMYEIYIARKHTNLETERIFEITSCHSKEKSLLRELSFSKCSPHFMEPG